MIKKAMILAAGFGKRIHPLTLKLPKPLLKIGNETLLSNAIKFLEQLGLKQVVINVHYLSEQISEYISKKKFNLAINIIEEKNEILDTGGGVLNAIQYFDNQPFLIINPDTIWSSNYFKEVKMMEEKFLQNKKNKCLLLVVNKNKSFDKTFKGDFDLKKDLLNRNDKKILNYIYTGVQIITPEVFSDNYNEVFSINEIWDKLIKKNELYGIESKINFSHVSTLDIYKKLLEKNFKH